MSDGTLGIENAQSRELTADEIGLVSGGSPLLGPGIDIFKAIVKAIVTPVPYDIDHGGFHVPS